MRKLVHGYAVALVALLLAPACVPEGDPFPPGGTVPPPPPPPCDYACSSDAWEIETVVIKGDLGKYASLAIGPDDTRYIAYHNGSDGSLDVVKRAPEGLWELEVVQCCGTAGRHAELAIDETGALHVTFQSLLGGLVYARSDENGAWVMTDLYPPSFTGTALAVGGPFNNAHHLIADTVLLYMSTFAGPSSIVDDFAEDPTLVLRDGRLHAVYTSSIAARAVYATKLEVGGDWELSIIEKLLDDGGPDRPGSAIAVGPGGAVHVLYRDPGSDRLRYAVRRGGDDWELRDFAPNGAWADLVFDAEGTLHASWGLINAAADRDLYYSRLGDDGQWTPSVVDAPGDVGLYTSIAVDGCGNVLIAYHDFGLEDLKLACRFGGGPE